jgi:carbonic anhydrase
MWRFATVVVGLGLLAAGCSGGEDHAAADALGAAARIDALETQVGDLQAALEQHLALADDGAAPPGPATEGAAEPDTASEGPATSTTETHTEAATPTTATTATPHWTYAGEAGAERWGDLDPSFATCATGAHQSPVDLGGAVGAPLADLVFQWHGGPATVVNDGHTVQVDLADGGDLVLDGHTYHLAQFHVHAPSEHTVNGRSFPLELHFVHRDADGRLAVVGVLVETGAATEALAPVLAAHPTAGGPAVPVSGTFDPSALLPLAPLRIAYRYDGSLTTPPCTEGVAWSVLFGSITVSAEQRTAITSQLAEPNHRPVQPLDGRPLRLDTSIG